MGEIRTWSSGTCACQDIGNRSDPTWWTHLARLEGRSRLAVASENAVEGCVRETWAARVGRHQARFAKIASMRAAMAEIAADEARHAALAWDLDTWARSHLGASEGAFLDDLRRRPFVSGSRHRGRMSSTMCSKLWACHLSVSLHSFGGTASPRLALAIRSQDVDPAVVRMGSMALKGGRNRRPTAFARKSASARAVSRGRADESYGLDRTPRL